MLGVKRVDKVIMQDGIEYIETDASFVVIIVRVGRDGLATWLE